MNRRKYVVHGPPSAVDACHIHCLLFLDWSDPNYHFPAVLVTGSRQDYSDQLSAEIKTPFWH